MINTITELTSEGVFETLSSLSNVKTNNPSPGDIYYDTTKNNKERMRKVKNIFKKK